MKPLQRYVLGFLSHVIAYEKLEKLTSQLSRHASVSTKRISATEVEVSFTPRPGVRERPFQCDNRIGSLEAIALLFTGRYADVQHPLCLHKEDECCRCVIRGNMVPYFLRKRYVRNINKYYIIYKNAMARIEERNNGREGFDGDT